jgi:hypothetical protein
MENLEDRVDKVLEVVYARPGSNFEATSSIPHTKTVIGYGETEEKAEKSLLKRILAIGPLLRWRFFNAIDKEFGRHLEEAPVSWSLEFKDKIVKVTVTDDLGRTASRSIKIKREKCYECEREGTSEFEEETG